MDPLGGAKEQMLRRFMAQITPSEHPIGQSLAEAVATFEHRQAAAVVELIEAADLDVEHAHNAEDRKDTLLSLADALLEDDLKAWWFDEIGSQHLEEADHARSYASLEEDEWSEVKRDWYQRYHEAGVVDVPLEDVDEERVEEISERHVEDRFGVSLSEFEDIVIRWDKGRVTEQLLGGVFDRHTRIIQLAAEEIEDLQEQNERLRERLQEADEDPGARE